VKSHALALALAAAAAAFVAASARADEPTPLVRHGTHVRGRANALIHGRRARSAPAAPVSCSAPGGTNFATDCAGLMPANEPAIATNGSQFVAGANDYNSWNGQGQDGFYWSSDGVTWNDDGPIDVFPHRQNAAAGDPGVAIDGAGVVYYSSLLFDPNDCSFGGLELLRRDPATGTWSYAQLAADSSGAFQDKPAIALGPGAVYVSWSHFGSCSGEGVTSPIQVATLPTGAASVAPTAVLDVPGSTYSQGSSVAADGSGGFWIAWEEFPTAGSTSGEIRLAHWAGDWQPFLANGGRTWETISPSGFRDLPSPLPGFAFRTDSFPALAMVGGAPWVAWASADGGVGRVHLWSGGTGAPAVSDTGGDQFFPALAADGSGGAFVSYGQTAAGGTYDWYLAHGADVNRVSQTSSTPNDDPFFAGQFVGDYSGIAVRDGKPYPIWTAVVPGGLFPQMQTMVFAGGRTAVAPGAPALSAPSAGNGLLHLHWTPPADDGGSAVTGYRIYRGTAAGGEAPVATIGPATSWDDTSVGAGTLYYYRVAAINGVGEGAQSNEVSAPSDLTVPVVAGGSPVTVTTTLPGENARLTFAAAAGQLVSVQLTGSTFPSGTVAILRPDGSSLTPKPFSGSSGFLDRTQLSADGTYTVLVDPTGTAVGTITVTLFAVPPDATASIVAGGPAVAVATTVPGQNAVLTFSGAAGQAVALQLSGVTISSGTVSLLRPDGAVLATKPFAVNGVFLDRTVLPVTGTYAIAIDPSGTAVGTATAKLYDVPPDVMGTITIGGPAVSVTTTVPGQNARLTFAGSAGEAVGLDVSRVTIPSGTVSILRPDGATLTSKFFSTSGAFVDGTPLPTTGTYTIVVDPSDALTGTATLKLADVPPDITGPIAAGGPPVTVTTTAPGQNVRLTFTGTAGQSVSLQLSGVTIANGTVSFLRPDGTTLAIKSFAAGTTFVDPVVLPTGGTYTVLIDPANAAVGSLTATLYDVPLDVTGTISVGGPSVHVNTTVPGQNARLTFNGGAGQVVTVTLSGVTMQSGTVSILRPGGATVAIKFFFAPGATLTATLPATGSYTLLVDPFNAATGAATVALT
jgi:Fibronectin type III domain